jgi:mono/diheme cytochrome c family protein
MARLSTSLLTTALAAAFCSTLAAQTAPPPAANAQAAGNTQNGKDLFLKYSCYACHGYDGHGGAGARLVPMRMTLPGFSNYVHNPRQMPPYTARVLSDAQLADLFAYIKSLPESPPAKNIPLLMRIINDAQIQKK